MSEAFPKNAGTYTVVAKNSAGEAQCSASVSVKVTDGCCVEYSVRKHIGL